MERNLSADYGTLPTTLAPLKQHHVRESARFLRHLSAGRANVLQSTAEFLGCPLSAASAQALCSIFQQQAEVMQTYQGFHEEV